jgi:hypothetical protein
MLPGPRRKSSEGCLACVRGAKAASNVDLLVRIPPAAAATKSIKPEVYCHFVSTHVSSAGPGSDREPLGMQTASVVYLLEHLYAAVPWWLLRQSGRAGPGRHGLSP